MKSYKQMAADVLHRAEVYTARKKRNQRIAVTAAAFGCLSVLLAVNIIKIGMGTKGNTPVVDQPTVQIGSQATEGSKATEGDQLQVQPSIPSSEEELPNDVKQNFDVVLLVATSPNDPGTELVENLALPMNYTLRVRDLRGLSDEEREQAINEERAQHRKLMDESLNGASVRYGNCTARENYVISFVRNGCFRLRIENYDLVESISIKCTTKYGKVDIRSSDYLWLKGWDVEIRPDDVSDYYRERPLEINWKYTTALLESLDEDPSMPLSSFSDVVTFTVKFLDGTVQETKVQITIQDDGQLVVSLVLDTTPL